MRSASHLDLERRDMWVAGHPWKTVSMRQLGAVTACYVLLVALLQTDSDGYIRILDDANLVFHEAGHPIFGLLGSTLGLYGGTLGQLAFPLIASVAFWRRREPASLAVTLAWFFENFFSIARYMADARAQVLPLVGGGQHDWTAILARWGVLTADTDIAATVRVFGWLGLASTWAWLAWRASITWDDDPTCRRLRTWINRVRWWRPVGGTATTSGGGARRMRDPKRCGWPSDTT